MVYRPTRPSRSEQGLAIITVMLVLSILAVIGLGIATMGAGHMSLASSQTRTEKAYLAADAAALYAVDAIAANLVPVQPTPLPTPISDVWLTYYPVRNLDPVNSPGVVINATVKIGPGTVLLPGSTNPITIPALHAYVLGRGLVGNGTSSPTEKYVGLMLSKSGESGLYYYGAYAKNKLDVSNSASVLDAWNSNLPSPNTPYTSAAQRVPYADVIGAGALTDIQNTTKLFGNADGPTIKTDPLTDFNNMGSAITPGVSCTLPNVNWPAVAPSPSTIPLNYTGPGTITIFPDEYSSINVVGGNVILAVPGDYNFSSLKSSGGGNIIANDITAPVSTPGEYKIYVQGGPCNVTGNSWIGTESRLPSALQIFYNGPAMTINGTGDVVGQIVACNTTGIFQMQDSATLTGSVIAFNDIKIVDTAQIHYDITLRPKGTGYNGSASFVGVKSHERL